MKRFLVLSLVAGVSFAAGRIFDGAPNTAAAGGGQGAGGGVAKCAAKNGDVNADGNVDLSDAVTILNYLFLGNPSQLVPTCRPAAEVRSDSILGVLLVLLDLVNGLGEVGVPSSCGGSAAVCCPGGNPLPQCGPLRFELMESPSVFASPDPTRFPFSLRLHVQSISDLPVNIPTVGDCGIRIDTTPGIPFIELRSEMVFREVTPEDGRPVVFSPFVLENFEKEDVTITGGLACASADSFTAFIVGNVRDFIVDLVTAHFVDQSLSGLCQPWAGCQRL